MFGNAYLFSSADRTLTSSATAPSNTRPSRKTPHQPSMPYAHPNPHRFGAPPWLNASNSGPSASRVWASLRRDWSLSS
jgi:hypothetical protein